MRTDRWALARAATTLSQAHDALSKLRPPANSSPATWREYYLRSAEIYQEIAEIDRGHHHEALYWVGRERRKAEEINEKLRRQP